MNNLPPGCLLTDLDPRDIVAEVEAEMDRQEAKSKIEREDESNVGQ